MIERPIQSEVTGDRRPRLGLVRIERHVVGINRPQPGDHPGRWPEEVLVEIEPQETTAPRGRRSVRLEALDRRDRPGPVAPGGGLPADRHGITFSSE